MRICRRFSVTTFALLVLIGSGTALGGPIVLAPSPVWQVETGVADWLVPATREAPLPALATAGFKPAARTDGFSSVQLLTRLANGLRNIRYKRGGRSPATGFDCSGFVRYVFRQAIGETLPNTSAAQFNAGLKIDREQLRSGDLVFFRTKGKRVSHVGIYLRDGEFIHAPSSGKKVSVSKLSDRYWSRRFAGARRTHTLVAEQPANPQASS